MLWQFSYGFSKFIVTRCSPDKLITFQAFYHINKISPQESKIIRSTSWFKSSFRTLAWKKIRQTHTHTHTQSFTHTLKTMSWALRLLGTRLLGTSNFRRHMAAFKREGNLCFLKDGRIGRQKSLFQQLEPHSNLLDSLLSALEFGFCLFSNNNHQILYLYSPILTLPF